MDRGFRAITDGKEKIVMANIKVAGEMYESLTGQLFEIARQLRQPSGYPFDPVQLKDHLQDGIEGRFIQLSGTFRYDKRKDGWKLLENKPRRINADSIITGLSFLKDGEESISGEEMALRAVQLDADYGQEDAEWLEQNQHKIPKEFQEYPLVFPGTKWRGRGVRRHVPCLHFFGRGWVLFFDWLGDGFLSSARLLSLSHK